MDQKPSSATSPKSFTIWTSDTAATPPSPAVAPSAPPAPPAPPADTPAPPADTPAPSADTPTPPQDSRKIMGFRTMKPEALPALNAEIGTTLDPEQWHWLKKYFTDTERRDPTVGEIRLFDRLAVATAGCPDRVAVGALYTDSDPLAATWADIVARHHTLTSVPERPTATSPCPLTHILPLPGAWLKRITPPAPAVAVPRMFADGRLCPAESMITVTRSQPMATVMSVRPDSVAAPAPATDRRRLCRTMARRTALFSGRPMLQGVSACAGDRLLRVRNPSPAQVNHLLLNGRAIRPQVVRAMPSGDASPMSATLALCNGAGLLLDRLLTQEEAISAPVRAVSTPPDHTARPETTDLYLRVRADGLQFLLDECKRFGLDVADYGRATDAGRFILRLQNTIIAQVNSAFLRRATAPVLRTYRPPRQTQSATATVTLPWLYQPTPDGTPTDIPARMLPSALQGYLNLPSEKLCVSAAETTLPEDTTAYARAMDTLLASVAILTARGIRRQEMALSVALREVSCTQDRGGNTTFAALCGLYRAAVELEIPLPDHTLTCAAAEGGTPSLSVWGYGTAPAPAMSVPLRLPCAPGHKLYLFFSEADAFTEGEPAPDFEEWRVMTDVLAQLLTTDGHGVVGVCPVMHDGRSPLDVLKAGQTAGILLRPACQALMERPFRLAFLVEATPDACLPGVEVGLCDGTAGLRFGSAPATPTAEEAPEVPVATSSSDVRPTALLPLIRKGDMTVADALIPRLEAVGYACQRLPLATEEVLTDAVPEEDGAVLVPAATTRRLTEAALAAWKQHLPQASVVVLALDRESTSVLLNQPQIRQDLDAMLRDAPADGTPSPLRLLAMGASCLSLAAAGYLPKWLTEEALTRIPAAGRICMVTDASGTVAARYCPSDLLCPTLSDPAAPAARYTLRTATHTVPDGFSGCDGALIAYVNGYVEM